MGGSTIILPRSSLARSIPYPSIPLSLYIPPPSTLTYHLSILCPPPPVGGTRICLVLGSAKASPSRACVSCVICVVWYSKSIQSSVWHYAKPKRYAARLCNSAVCVVCVLRARGASAEGSLCGMCIAILILMCSNVYPVWYVWYVYWLG